MTYSQRQFWNRILFWIQLLIIVVCGAYILYEAISFEIGFPIPESMFLNETYLIGRYDFKVAFTTICCGFATSHVYRSIAISDEDRALLRSNSSASVLLGTCPGRLSFYGPGGSLPGLA